MLTLVTWNVNSIRARLERLLAFLERARPDCVCLQELKVTDADFPRAELEAAGWQVATHGQKTYNGVAILSRTPLDEVAAGMDDGVEDGESRLLTARTAGVRVTSAYVPNGKTVGSDKWAYKLAWLDRLDAWLARTLVAGEPYALCGDFNIAPEDRDAARPDEWRDTVLCHDDVRARFRRIEARGLVDTMRLHHEGPGPFTWWDYRMLGFPKNNGLRIDHVLASASLADACASVRVDRDERKGKLPSDHAPVLAVFTR